MKQQIFSLSSQTSPTILDSVGISEKEQRSRIRDEDASFYLKLFPIQNHKEILHFKHLREKHRPFQPEQQSGLKAKFAFYFERMELFHRLCIIWMTIDHLHFKIKCGIDNPRIN